MASYGPSILALLPNTYETQVALILNQNRIMFQRANTIAWGIVSAMGTSPLPLEYFEALCDTDLEAQVMEIRTNSDRSMMDVLSKRSGI